MPRRNIEIHHINQHFDLHIALSDPGVFDQLEKSFPFDFMAVNPVDAVEPGDEVESDSSPVGNSLREEVAARRWAVASFKGAARFVDQNQPGLVGHLVEHLANPE